MTQTPEWPPAGPGRWVRASALAVVCASWLPGPSAQEPATRPPPTAEREDPEATEPRDLPRPPDAAALFARLRSVQGFEARFREEKHLKLLVAPLRSAGRLYYLRGGYMTRVVEAPEPARVAISPETLEMVDADGEKTIDLRASDELATFVTSLVQVFSGDREQLEETFDVAFAHDEDDERGWSLTLRPRREPLTGMMRSLVVVGVGRAVARVEVTAPNGDLTITRVTEADPQREFSAAEKERLFGIRPDPRPATGDGDH